MLDCGYLAQEGWGVNVMLLGNCIVAGSLEDLWKKQRRKKESQYTSKGLFNFEG